MTALIDAPPPAEPTVDSSRFGVEKRGIDHVPAAERTGSARRLGLMWSGVVLNAQVVVYVVAATVS